MNITLWHSRDNARTTAKVSEIDESGRTYVLCQSIFFFQSFSSNVLFSFFLGHTCFGVHWEKMWKMSKQYINK